MRLHFILKTAVIISLFLSLTNTYAQSNAPFISQLEGMNGGKEARLTITDGILNTDYVVQYRLKNATDWIDSPLKIRKNTNVTEDTLTGLESDKNYCFRVLEKDSITKAETVSNEVCSVSLKSTLISDTEVRLEWDKIELDMTKDNRFSIVYMEEDGANKNSALLSLSDTVWNFEYLNCSKKYRFYMLISSYSTETGPRRLTEIKSPEILVDPTVIETLPALKQSFGMVSIGEKNEIRYNVFSIFDLPQYEYYRSVNGGEMIKIGESRLNQFNDMDVDTDKNHYCYAYRYISECGKKSELSGKSCTMKLSSETNGKLSWTPFAIEADSTFLKKEKVEYTVEMLEESGSVVASWVSTHDTTTTINLDSFPYFKTVPKFRVLAVMNSQINYGQIMLFPFFSYSNTVSLYTILGNENLRDNLTVFPNPAEDKIQINSSGVPVRFVEMIDMKGRLIHKGETSGDTFDVSGYEKGKYILRLYDTNRKLLSSKNIMKW